MSGAAVPAATVSGTAVPAATVIVARDGAEGLEILVIERARSMGFAGGAIAFPGGKVDAGDLLPADLPVLRGFAGLAAEDAAARICAAREAFEEAGILLSEGPFVAAGERARLRRLSDSHAISFGELLSGIGHRLDAGRLAPFARWVPPAGFGRRFDTHFLVASLPPGEVHDADGHEAVSARFVRPADLLAEAEAGRASLLFPTLCNVQRLGRFGCVAELLADATPPPFIEPAIDDGWLTIPENVGYPVTRIPVEVTRRQ